MSGVKKWRIRLVRVCQFRLTQPLRNFRKEANTQKPERREPTVGTIQQQQRNPDRTDGTGMHNQTQEVLPLQKQSPNSDMGFFVKWVFLEADTPNPI